MSIRSNKKGLSRGPAAGLTALLSLLVSTAFAPEFPSSFVYAQSAGRVRNLAVDFVPEGGCPVEPTNIRCELDVDPFDAPMDARVYVDYRNNSDRAVAAVKFRLRFVDARNVDKGTFHAVDMTLVAPQGSHGLKAKKDFTLHPAVVALKARVLQVKYQDGSDWTSTKMQELAQPASVPGGGGFTINGGGGNAGNLNNGAGSSDDQGEMPARSAPPVQSYAPYSAAPAQTQAQNQAQIQNQNQVQTQAQTQAPQRSSPPPWSANPREYENPAAAVPPSGRGLSAGADVVDSFAAGSSPQASPPPAVQSQMPVAAQGQMPVQSPAQAAAPTQAPAAAESAPLSPANAPANSAASSAAASAASAPSVPASGRYQGVQPTNVPYSPDNDK